MLCLTYALVSGYICLNKLYAVTKCSKTAHSMTDFRSTHSV